MSFCYTFLDYKIFEKDDELFWYQAVDEIVFTGKAFILDNINTLLIAPYEEILSEIPEGKCENWEKTDYFALISETGNVNFFEIQSGKKVPEKIETKLRENLGCTTRFRNSS